MASQGASSSITGTVTAAASVTLRLQPDAAAPTVADPAPGTAPAAAPRLRWSEDTLNNEGLGRRSSKRCCIFHKQRKFGESSSEDEDGAASHAEAHGPHAHGHSHGEAGGAGCGGADDASASKGPGSTPN